jgi:hypothetical protein
LRRGRATGVDVEAAGVRPTVPGARGVPSSGNGEDAAGGEERWSMFDIEAVQARVRAG